MLAYILALTFAVSTPSILSIPVQRVEAAELSIPELKAIATSSAARYKLSPAQERKMLATITCESNWDVNAASLTGDYGIVQIHEKAHPEIMRAQMLDPYFALDWMAHEWSLGHQKLWSCYTLLYK